MSNSTLYFQCLVGMQCKNFAIIAADQTNTQSIIVMKHDEKKLYEISNRLVMGAIGDPGDRVQFVQFIDKNLKLYKMRNGYQLSTAAVVHFTRKTMMEALKNGVGHAGFLTLISFTVMRAMVMNVTWSDCLSELNSWVIRYPLNPSMVNMLVAGYDEADGGQLYTVDFLASALRVPYGVHGFGGLLSMSILDRYHKPDLTELEAYELIKRCVREIHERLFISLPNFLVKVINKQGIKEMPVITPATHFTDHPA